MKRALTVILSVMMLAFGAVAFAACGDGNDEDADKVTLQALTGEADVVGVLQKAESGNTEAYGVLGEPSLTNGQSEVKSAKVAIDFQEEWKALTGYDGYPQASLIARSSFAQENGAFIEAITAALKENAQWLSDAANVARFEQALEKYNEENAGGYQTTLASYSYTAETIERCNLGYQSAQEVKESVKDYVGRLNGTEPDDGFFYTPAETAAQTDGDAETVHVYLPDGTPALAVANIFTEGVQGYDIEFHIVQAANIGSIFSSQQDADLAIMPTIGAATVYGKARNIQLVSTNVFGNLYIASVNGTVSSLGDLKGKTVSTPSAATTVQLLQYILEQNEIEYING